MCRGWGTGLHKRHAFVHEARSARPALARGSSGACFHPPTPFPPTPALTPSTAPWWLRRRCSRRAGRVRSDRTQQWESRRRSRCGRGGLAGARTAPHAASPGRDTRAGGGRASREQRRRRWCAARWSTGPAPPSALTVIVPPPLHPEGGGSPGQARVVAGDHPALFLQVASALSLPNRCKSLRMSGGSENWGAKQPQLPAVIGWLLRAARKAPSPCARAPNPSRLSLTSRSPSKHPQGSPPAPPRLARRICRARGAALPARLPAMAQFLKQASALKVKEVPQFVQKYASENLTPAVVEGRFTRWYNTYKKTVRMRGRRGGGGGRRTGGGARLRARATAPPTPTPPPTPSPNTAVH